MFIQNSQSVNTSIISNILKIPCGTGLNGPNPSLPVIDGSVALNIGSNDLYYVGGNVWKLAGGAPPSISLSVVGSSPNNNAATLTGTVLNLEPANGFFPGVVSTVAQTFSGTKTFSNIIAPGTNYVTIDPTAGTVNNDGLFINNTLNQINLEFADSTHNGIVSTVAQTFSGTKTFSNIIAPGTNYVTIDPTTGTVNNDGLFINNTLNQINLEFADSTHNGIVSTVAQTFSGTKTFSNIIAPGTNYVTIDPTTGTVNNDGLFINNTLNQINLEFADSTHNGIVSTVAQTFSGTKTFSAISLTGAGNNVFGADLLTPKIASIINTGVLTLPTTTDTLIGRDTNDILTNKTITSTTNNVAAKSLHTLTTTVNVSLSPAPVVGQVLTATSGTSAIWQNPSSLTSTWILLGSNSLLVQNNTLTVNLSSPKRWLHIVGWISSNNAPAVQRLRFNSDAGNNYSFSRSDGVSPVTTGTTISGISIAQTPVTNSRFFTAHVSNLQMSGKVVVLEGSTGNAVSGVAPVINHVRGVWGNNVNLINIVELNTTGQMQPGTELFVWGTD